MTMDSPAGLAYLPTELLLIVIEFLGQRAYPNVNAMCLSSRGLHSRLLPILIDMYITDPEGYATPVRHLLRIFDHAILHDSLSLIQHIVYYGEIADFKG